MQLVYANMGATSYSAGTLDNVMHVNNDATNSLLLRTGVQIGAQMGAKTNGYFTESLLYDFLGDVKTTVTGDSRSAVYDDSIGGFGVLWGVGLDHQVNNTSSLHFDIGRLDGGEVTEGWAVNANYRISF